MSIIIRNMRRLPVQEQGSTEFKNGTVTNTGIIEKKAYLVVM